MSSFYSMENHSLLSSIIPKLKNVTSSPKLTCCQLNSLVVTESSLPSSRKQPNSIEMDYDATQSNSFVRSSKMCWRTSSSHFSSSTNSGEKRLQETLRFFYESSIGPVLDEAVQLGVSKEIRHVF
jgi:hypothetical protein